MYVPQSTIIQLFLKSVCPAWKSCHPSPALFCCAWGAASTSSNHSIGLSLIPQLPPSPRSAFQSCSCFQRHRALGCMDFIFRAFPFIFPGGVPLGAAPRALRALWLCWAVLLLLLTPAQCEVAPCEDGTVHDVGLLLHPGNPLAARWAPVAVSAPLALLWQLPLPSALQRNLVTVCLSQLKCNWE